MLSYAAAYHNVGPAVQLYHEAMVTIHKLTQASIGGRAQFADFVLVSLLEICTERALQIVTNAPDSSAQVHLTESLADALTRSVSKLTKAAYAHPQLFIKAARRRFQWPMLWEMRDSAEEPKRLAGTIQLGADLGLKSEGAISFQSKANAIVALSIYGLDKVRPLLLRGVPLPQSAPHLLKELTRIEVKFPPLSQDPAAVDFWWRHGVRPLIESDKENLLASRDLASYRDAAAKKRNDPRYRAKEDTRAWNLFMGDCRKALARMAPPVTDKPEENP
jgi:hypothetical protein